MPIPKHHELFNPVLQALKKLGGSGSVHEIDEEVIKDLNLTEQETSQLHKERGKETRETEVEYQLAWARTYLKKYGLINNSKRGIWALTAEGHKTDAVDSVQVRRRVEQRKDIRQPQSADRSITEESNAPEVVETFLEQKWKEQLSTLLLGLQPDAFERLCQRLLRESGFTQVRVTGRPGDDGIDGVGLVQLGGLLSFPVVFQCKRYRGSVGAGEIRNFRGAMVGRADRGLFITTGTFTQSARQEATRDGVPLIDLVDGEQLVEKLKELGLGVTVKMIEEVTILPEWFKEI